MAVPCTLPLVVPLHYEPSFKVDVRLHEPLLSREINQAEIEIELMALCSQLDVLCKKELKQQPSGKIVHGRVSSAFSDKATMVHDRMNQLLLKSHNSSLTLGQYIVSKKLDLLFPRTAAYLADSRNFSLKQSQVGLDCYYQEISALQNLWALSYQINSDLQNLSNHKYIAHQMAILYHSINNVGKAIFDPYKKSIEENFKSIKASLNQETQDGRQLLPEQKEWFLDLTSGIVKTISCFPQELTDEMIQPASFLKQL